MTRLDPLRSRRPSEAFLAVNRAVSGILTVGFGWAVRALFGPNTAAEQTFLSVVVGAAVAWSVIVVGAMAPDIVGLTIAHLPTSRGIAPGTIRLVLVGAALLIPPTIGISVAAPRPARIESRMLTLLRGFPVTVGLSAAFLVMCVSVPLIRLGALWRGRRRADMLLVTNDAAYHDVAGTIFDVLNHHGLCLRRVAPRWSVAASLRLFIWLSGDTFRAYLPRRPEHFRSSHIELLLYPNGLRLCGEANRLTLAQGLIAESVAHTEGLQTADPKAQALERRMRRLWRIYDETPAQIVGSENLLQSLEQVTRELGTLKVGLDDWQALYRQILQVGRAIHGQRQLMDIEASTMASEWDAKTPVDRELPRSGESRQSLTGRAGLSGWSR